MKDFGTHSFRKGVSSYLSSVMDGPGNIPIFNRLGWSIGNVQQRYISDGDAGQDNYIGRIVVGRTPTNMHFCELPPHFANYALSHEELVTIVPNYESYPTNFKQCIPYLIASVVFHAKEIRSKLLASDVLFTSNIFRLGYVNKLSQHVVTGQLHCPSTNMEATGIPLEILNRQGLIDLGEFMREQFGIMKSAINQCKEEIRDDIVELHEDIDEIPTKTAKSVEDAVTIEGVKEVSKADFLQFRNELVDKVSDSIKILSGNQ